MTSHTVRLAMVAALIAPAALAFGATAPTTPTTTTTPATTTTGTTSTTGSTTGRPATATGTAPATSTTGPSSSITIGTAGTTTPPATTTPAATTPTSGTASAAPFTVILPISGDAPTASELESINELAANTARFATYGFRFFYVHRIEDEFTDMAETHRGDRLYWHADEIADDDRWSYALGADAMYINLPDLDGTTEGVTIGAPETRQMGGRNVVAVTIDPSAFSYDAWLDSYRNNAGESFTQAQYNAMTEAQRGALYIVRSPLQQNHSNRMASADHTVNVTVDLGPDAVNHLVANALISYYRTQTAEYKLLNFVAHAYVSGISNLSVTQEGETWKVTADIALRIPNDIYLHQGAEAQQWRYNYFNIRDFSGIDAANSYYGAGLESRGGYGLGGSATGGNYSVAGRAVNTTGRP
jgi:hypothetical protein